MPSILGPVVSVVVGAQQVVAVVAKLLVEVA